jgi:hypothetical protein
MRDMPDQLGSGDVPIEDRDPRFAELDAQIQAAKANPQQRPAERKRKGQRARPPLPREVRKEINQCARQLRQHRKLFITDPKLRDRASRFLRSLLPPHRRRGRPGIAAVTTAIRLLNRFKRQYPAEKPAQIWNRVYPEVILGYVSMNKDTQRAQRLLLRERVRSRRKWRLQR